MGVDTGRRDRLATTLRSYLVPRIESPEAPFLVAFAGPTGSGKSTLVNSVSGLDLAETGSVRPTTTIPMVLTAATEPMVVGGIECRTETGGAPILNEMHLVDTPDLDSTSSHHRVIAETIIDHADVVVFVTSALRYADNVPWEVLRRAKYRGAVVIPVLNRIGPDSAAAVADFRRRLGDAGLDDDPVRVPEHYVGGGTSQVHSLAVRDLRKRLYWVARDRARHQAEVVNRVLNSTTQQVRQLISDVTSIAAELDVIETEMISGILGEAELPLRRRPWAAFPLPDVPTGRKGRWLRRSQPTTAELAVWRVSVQAGLVAEAESRLRTAVAVYGSPVLTTEPKLAARVVAEARPALGAGFDAWFDSIGAKTTNTRVPRLEIAVAVAGALTTVEAEVATTVIGTDCDQVFDRLRSDLNAKLGSVFEGVAGSLSSQWRSSVGDPAVDDLGERLVAVAAAYQFADA